MCVRKKETFSLLTYDNSTYHALAFLFFRMHMPGPCSAHLFHQFS